MLYKVKKENSILMPVGKTVFAGKLNAIAL